MANQLIVFSETRQNWIAPHNAPIRVLSGRLRRREGDEALIEVGTGWFKRDEKLHACFYVPPQRKRVRVEYSIGIDKKKRWWIVDMERP